MGRFLTYMVEGRRQTIRLIDAEPIEQALFKQADKSLAKNPYDNTRICAFRNAPTIAPPPNDPLTLEELREMDGEPVWVVFIPDADGETLALWALVSVDNDDGEVFLLNSLGGSSAYEEVWADVRAIYRRRPEDPSP